MKRPTLTLSNSTPADPHLDAKAVAVEDNAFLPEAGDDTRRGDALVPLARRKIATRRRK